MFGLFKRYQILSLLLLTALFMSSCSQTRPDAVNLAMNTSGFGGTGKQLDPTSGFGGTGKSSSGFGGTGIIGTITEFGSIWVNGVEIGYGDKTQISSNLKKHDSLKLGQQVVLKTEPVSDKTVTRKIQIFYPIAGEITRLNKHEIEVSGKYKVVINKKTLVDKGMALSKGRYIAINGYQQADHQWIATRLNVNEQEKTLYQPVPQIEGGEKVNRWIIESGYGQIKHYENQLQISSGMMKDSRASQHVVLEVIKDSSGKSEIKSMMPYPEFFKVQKREHDALEVMKMHQQGTQHDREQFLEQHQQIEMQQEQKNIMHMQQEQKEVLKEMQQQQQEVHQQMETIKEMNSPERH